MHCGPKGVTLLVGDDQDSPLPDSEGGSWEGMPTVYLRRQFQAESQVLV
jgi:hypothetical protein